MSHDILVQVLVSFLLSARLKTDNRLYLELGRLSNGNFGISVRAELSTANDGLPLLGSDSVSILRWVQSATLPPFEHALHARSIHAQFFLTQEAQGLRSAMKVR